MKIRLKSYEPDDLNPKDEVIEKNYEEPAELGFHATHEQIENWTPDLRENTDDVGSDTE